jgi:hypothetical protein
MPAIGDLDRIRQRFCGRFAVAAATIASDDRNLGMVGKPRLCRRRLSIRQQPHNAPLFQIANNAAVAVFAAPSPHVADSGCEYAAKPRRRTDICQLRWNA